LSRIVNYCLNARTSTRVVTIVLGCVVWSLAASVHAADVRETALAMRQKYAAKLELLAAWCDEQGLAEQATQTRERAKPADPNVIRVLALPVRVGETSELAADAPKNVAEWHRRYWLLRREQAKRYFQLARTAIHAGQPSLAFDLVHAAVAEDPDYEPVRRLLGYQEFHGQWRTRWEIQKLRADNIWDERFGWIRKAELPRYEKGERPYRGRWISAEEDARLHADIRRGWDVETEHYSIRTSHGIEAAVRLGRRLEDLYRVWRQIFVCYYATPQQVEAMFDRQAPRMNLPRFKVVYFRDRAQYQRDLAGVLPGIENSEGVYLTNMRRAYFFGGDDADEETVLHEATHQLFYESRPVARAAGESANCWVIEGIAVYMETLRREGDYYVLGGFDRPRMKAARYRLFKSQFYVPFETLSRYGLGQLQADPNMPKLYSQIAGWTEFLVYYDQGRYRDALVDYLIGVYNGSQDPTLLARLCRTSYDELDREYREFMQEGRVKREE